MLLFSGMFFMLLFSIIGPVLLIALAGAGVFMRNRRLRQNRDRNEPYIDGRNRQDAFRRSASDQYIESEFIDEESDKDG